MSYSLNKTEVIADGLDHVDGFCATEVGGKPRLFYCGDADENKGPALMLWEGAGEPRVIGHLPKE